MVILNITGDRWEGEWNRSEGDVSARVLLYIDASEGGAPFLMIGTNETGMFGERRISLQSTAYPAGATHEAWAIPSQDCYSNCSRAPPWEEYAFIFGTMEGSASLTVGMELGGGSLGFEALNLRPQLSVVPDGTGADGFAGTSYRYERPGVAVGYDAGVIERAHTEATALPAGMGVDERIEIRGQRDVQANGTATARIHLREEATHSDWQLAFDLGNVAREGSGTTVQATSPVGDRPVGGGLSRTPEPGELSIHVEREAPVEPVPDASPQSGYTPERLVDVTWGWIDEDLEALTGWSFDGRGSAGSRGTLDPFPEVSSSGESLCMHGHEEACAVAAPASDGGTAGPP